MPGMHRVVVYTVRTRRERTVYTGVQGPKGRVHGAATAVYRVHLHGRVPCTRPCLRPVYTAAHGRVQTVYTAVFTARVHGIVRTVYTAVHVHGP